MSTTEDAPTTEGQPERAPAPIRHLRWLIPLALALLVFLVFALVEAVHASDTLSRPTTIQSAGFIRPTKSTPVPFSLTVLQEPAAGHEFEPTQRVTMVSLRGKPLVLNMWASWCTICRTETPAVESVASRLGGSVNFVGIDTLDKQTQAIAFLHRYHVTYLQLFDPDEHVFSGYAMPGLPATVFVSARGKVVGGYLGALNAKTLEHYITTLFGARFLAAG